MRLNTKKYLHFCESAKEEDEKKKTQFVKAKSCSIWPNFRLYTKTLKYLSLNQLCFFFALFVIFFFHFMHLLNVTGQKKQKRDHHVFNIQYKICTKKKRSNLAFKIKRSTFLLIFIFSLEMFFFFFTSFFEKKITKMI